MSPVSASNSSIAASDAPAARLASSAPNFGSARSNRSHARVIRSDTYTSRGIDEVSREAPLAIGTPPKRIDRLLQVSRFVPVMFDQLAYCNKDLVRRHSNTVRSHGCQRNLRSPAGQVDDELGLVPVWIEALK